MGSIGRVAAALVVVTCALAPTGAASASAPLEVVSARFEPLDAAPVGVTGVGEFRGAIEVRRAGAGVAVINDVALDDYLRGISEVPVSWPLEAQKAQAVAARTYALWEVGRKANAAYKSVGADICATDSCQVYAGVDKERRPGSGAWSAAVEQTKGQVLLYRGAPIVAKYSSSNGGRTVDGGRPYLRAGDDADDRYSPLHRWNVTFPVEDVVRAVGLAPESVSIRRDGDEVVASSPDGSGGLVEHRLPAADFRSRINSGLPKPPDLPLAVPSIRFDVATSPDGVVSISGRGWGHGIGLSQYGALGKALRGLKAPDILAAYYAGLRPVTVPPERVPAAVRVALAVDRPDATVSTTGHFRVIGDDGAVLAHRASGAWAVVPTRSGRLRLVPPPSEAAPPAASIAAVEPATPRPADPLVVRIELTGPAALTRLLLVGPDGAATELDPPALRPAGPVVVRLGGASTAQPGGYRIDVERDAGGGRAATTALVLDVRPPSPAPAPAPPTEAAAGTTWFSGGDGGGAGAMAAWQLVAVLLLGSVIVAALRMGRRAVIPLH